MDSLYYGEHAHGCPCCGGTRFENSIRFDADVLSKFLRKVYNGFDTSNEIEPTIWREVLRVINQGTVEGLSQAKIPPTHDRLFYQNLRHSNEVFAAFKVHMMGRDMAAKLIDTDGSLKPFDRWVRDVSGITSHQIGSWLRTEYDTAVIRAHAAADWQEFERNILELAGRAVAKSGLRFRYASGSDERGVLGAALFVREQLADTEEDDDRE